MVILLTILYVLISVFLVIVVLLQSGKAADLAGAFGGMGSQTAFGPRGSTTVLSKATAVAAALFMALSLVLAIMASRNAGTGSSVVERNKGSVTKPVTSAPLPQNPAAGTTPTVTVTPLGKNGEKGESRTMPMPVAPPPAQQQQPAKK
jgi:preprotein translocase subunit SecG